MPTSDIDFAAVKSAVAIDQVLQMLHLPKVTRNGEQFRSPCPACKTGGDRALVVTPSRKAYYCFAAKRGGDCVALVAHVQSTGQREAAMAIQNHFGLGNSVDTNSRNGVSRASPEPERKGVGSPVFKAMDRLSYLDAHHDSVQGLGVSAETIEHFDGGYANRGVMRGRLALPIHTHDGTLIAYVGLSVSEDQQPPLQFHNFEPDRYLFNLNNVTADDVVYIARHPLEVLQAYEGGVTNVAAFLSPITASALLVLSNWMDEKGIESVEIQ